eukprot:5112689-Prorocentrum_lima.AAC.1
MTSSLVGSEMCIRDSSFPACRQAPFFGFASDPGDITDSVGALAGKSSLSVSYTHLTLPTICSV